MKEDNRQLKQQTTAMATKTSLKKWIRTASNFMTLFLSRLIGHMLANFVLVEF